MPQRRAAKKDLRQNRKRKQANLKIKKKLKTAAKSLKQTLTTKDSAKIEEALKQVCKLIDKAASKNVIHANKAARKKSRLTKAVKKLPKPSKTKTDQLPEA